MGRSLSGLTNGAGSLYVDATHPRFYIWNWLAPTENMLVSKVGRASGWTMGTVSDTCFDESFGSNRVLLCQGIADFYGSPGDSGSPVCYWWWFYDVDTVELVGLFWGSDGNVGGQVLQPMGQRETWERSAVLTCASNTRTSRKRYDHISDARTSCGHVGARCPCDSLR
jgi:hypothetical protein